VKHLLFYKLPQGEVFFVLRSLFTSYKLGDRRRRCLKIGVGIATLVEVSETLLDLIKALADLSEVEIFILYHHHLWESPLEISDIKVKQIEFKEACELLKDDLDMYLSTEKKWIYEMQILGVFCGYMNSNHCELQLAFDQRLFKDETNNEGLIKWIQLVGKVQKRQSLPIKVSLVTYRGASIERGVKVLFRKLGCEINSICFLTSGGKDEVFQFFDSCLYFECQKMMAIQNFLVEKPLLFVEGIKKTNS